MLDNPIKHKRKTRQRGASAVEFGIIATLFFTLFFGIIEFGRFFYLYNTVQEVTRCAARLGVVNWRDQWGNIQQQCLFGHDTLVAGWEIGSTNIRLRHLNACGDADEVTPGSAPNNIVACAGGTPEIPASSCIHFVEASVQACDQNGNNCQRVRYRPMFGLVPLRVDIPNSTVCMPAESLGYGM